MAAVLRSELKVGAWADVSRGERRSLKICHLDVRKEASLDIKDVIHQTSCFSKTIMMNITQSSVH